MSYYGAGDYYGAGGYYARGGLLSSIGGALKKVGQAAVGFATGGPLGAVSAVLPRTGVSAPSTPAMQLTVPTQSGQIQIRPGAILPGGAPFISIGRRRRRMNFANGRALNRANRRVDGFVRLARKSLKHTQYRIVTKGSGRKSKPSVLVETGPGGIRA